MVPVKSATVRLIPSGQFTGDANQGISAISDDQGRFEFKDISPGSYELRAEHTGFVASRRSSLHVRLNPGENAHEVGIRMTPAAVVTGRVVNENGEPMANVGVEALRYAYSPAGRRLSMFGGASTNDQGEYRMYGLAPGRYYVRAKPNRDNVPVTSESVVSGSAHGKAPEMGYPGTYYPGVVSAQQAATVELRPGDQASIDFNLAPVRTFDVRGRLPDSSAGALGTAVMLFDSDGLVGESIAHGGSFDLHGVLPGTYRLLVMGMMGPGKPQRLCKTIQVGQADVDNVELEASPALSGIIHGQIRVAGSSRPDLSQLLVGLEPADRKQDALGASAGMANDPGDVMPGLGLARKDGSFKMAMPNGGPGVYYTAIGARGPGLEDFYSKSVIYGGKDVTETGLTLPTSSAALEIVIAGDGATVQGSVVDDKNEPVDDVTVVAIPASRSLRRWTELYQQATGDQKGHFILRGLRPGDYQVFAWDDMEPYAFLDPDFLRAYEGRGQALKAEPNGRYALVLHPLDGQRPEP